MKMTRPSIRLRLLIVCLISTPFGSALANEAAATTANSKQNAGKLAKRQEVFTLGQISVTAPREDETSISTTSINREDLWDFSRDGLKEALDILPGATITAGAGNRNEAIVSIRGFNRFQVPLMLDGIRLYLPADNRIDFDRFLTPDLSEIQVSKGYVSVLNGPDGMGGAINLVTRKPVKPLESELRLSALTGGKGQYNGYTAYANIGSRQEQFYYLASFQQRDIKHWRMSNHFRPTPAENGGKRDNTAKQDWRVTLKAGFTPNTSDEYSLNFATQQGEKHGIGSVTGKSTISTWDWPKWNTWSLYWLSQTKLSENTYLKSRLYYNQFDNDLVAFTNTSLDQKNWISHFDDHAQGLILELGTTALPQQTLKSAVHYRRDVHTRWQDLVKQGSKEPKRNSIEDNYSLALEDIWHVSPQFDLIAGLSREIRHSRKSEDYTNGAVFRQKTADHSATSVQGAAIYRYRNSGKAYFSASRRHRFPTMHERFSSRFGGALSNPLLKPERATNFEIGLSDKLMPNLLGEFALFHSRIDDAIESVSVHYKGKPFQQSQNVGEAAYKGVELNLQAEPWRELALGGNYTYIDTSVSHPENPQQRLTGTPRHKLFAYAKWQMTPSLRLIPSLEFSSARWSTIPGESNYASTGRRSLFNFKLEYQINRNLDVSVAANNLLDKNYEPNIGYPAEGRNFLLSIRYRL